MTRGRVVFLASSAVLVSAITAGSWAARAASRPEGESDSLFKYLSVFSEVLSLVKQAYVDETQGGDLLASAMEGATDALDPHSLFVPAAGVTRYAAVRAVGIERSGLRVLNENGLPYVVTVVEGSPAAKAGFERGDLLSKVGERSTRTLPRWELEALFAGAVGEKVTVELIRGAEPLQKTLEFASFTPAPPVVEERDGVAVVRFSWIDADSAAWLKRTLDKMARAPQPAGAPARAERSLVIDLRNASGPAESGYAVAGLFGGKDLGSLVGSQGDLQAFRGEAAASAWPGKVIVATNRWTQDAAEILAAVLRQTSSAKVVGEPSFGSVGRQAKVDVASGGSLWITEGFYAGPDRKVLREGLEPDVRVRDRERAFSDRETSLDDLILRRALEAARGTVTESTVAKAA
jgi:carboxyl-terminal processing protease